MQTTDLLKKVRKVEIKARGLSNNIFAGQYHSAFKGRGMAFSEVREYAIGDDVRDIDWNVTARYHKPFVKIYEEERELTVMLLIDVSKSLNFGSFKQEKRDLAAEIGATLAFSALQNNDKVGAIFFSDKIEKFIPPKKGRKHVLFIIREMLAFEPIHIKTDIAQALKFLTGVIKKKCSAFLISDFIDDQSYLLPMQIANRKHDVMAIQVYDTLSSSFPNVGLIQLYDPELDTNRWIDTASANTRDSYRNWWISRQRTMEDAFKRCEVDYVSVSTEDDFVKKLILLFNKRGQLR